MSLSYRIEPMRGNLMKIDSPLLVHLFTIILRCGTDSLAGKVIYMPPNGLRHCPRSEAEWDREA